MTDSKEHVLYNKEGTGEQKDEEGKFAFTTDDQDVFEVCFQSKSTGGFSNGMFLTFCENIPDVFISRSHHNLWSIRYFP